MPSGTQEAVIDRQFGAQAAAYLSSAVHAQGADLDALVEIVPKDARVLDLGCGAGHVSFKAAAIAREVIAYDLSADMLAVVAKAAQERGLDNIRTEQGMAERIALDDASFDVVLSRYSAHHWRDFDAGLREAARVLKPGGLFAAVDIISPGPPLFDSHLQAVELLRDPSHVRNYSAAEWAAALERTGLSPTAASRFRIRLDFKTWVERMRTPKIQIEAIRALQLAMAETVSRYFEIAPDGSFTLDVGLFEANK